MDATSYIVIFISAIFASIIHSTMGFGSPLVLLNVLPLFFTLTKSVAVMQVSLIVLNIYFCVRYINKISWKVLVPALIPATVLGLVFTLWAVSLDSGVLYICLGAVFIFLSLYELFISGNVKIRPSRSMGFLMGSCSGITNAFFGIAGPPIVMYLVPSTEDNLQYFATSQAFFFLSSVPCLIGRLVSGVYETTDIPVIACLIAGLLLGSVFGIKVLKKIDSKVFRKLVYGFIGINGIYLIVRQLV